LIVEAVGRELDVKPEARRTHRLIDGTGKESGETITMDHVFRLLGLIHSREPLRIAHRALRSADEHLKGTSLEYLENILPDDLWQRLLPLFEDRMLSGSVTTN
jgi:hypothetical protein